jgi:hypothetical protein
MKKLTADQKRLTRDLYTSCLFFSICSNNPIWKTASEAYGPANLSAILLIPNKFHRMIHIMR